MQRDGTIEGEIAGSWKHVALQRDIVAEIRHTGSLTCSVEWDVSLSNEMLILVNI